MRQLTAFGLIGSLALVAPAEAAPKSVTLSIPSMDCAACPITIKQALGKIEGVKAVSSSLEKRQTVVRFDDAKVTTQQITDATTNAGFPATVLKP